MALRVGAKQSKRRRLVGSCAPLLLAAVFAGCTLEDPNVDEKHPVDPGGGGTESTGGKGRSTGGRNATGGVTQTSGGSSQVSGGAVTTGGSGGSDDTGGAPGVGGVAGSGGESTGGASTSGGGSVDPGEYEPPLHGRLKLTHLRPGLALYNPHQARGATVKGSTHTHCAPDHSGIESAVQEARLRDLSTPNNHDFVFMTAHNFVAPSPNVPGILHMFGVEVYAVMASGAAPHMLALLPNGALADVNARPFGYYSTDVLGASTAIRNAGGLPVLAHPLRYAIPDAEAVMLDERLWGIEIMSATGVVRDNLGFADAFLSRGKYVCLTAGGDIHDEDYSLTRGHIVVSVPTKTPSMSAVFDSVRACNFFACGVINQDTVPLDPPDLEVRGGRISVTVKAPATLRFVGNHGTVLKAVTNATAADYTPQGGELYVRVEAEAENAACYSQPLWLVSS